jgi:transcriptional regulator with XRE-family HTH domain
VTVKVEKLNDATVRRAFGRVLRSLREARFLTQDELAERADCSQVYISLLEQGKQSPSLVRLFDLAAALGIDPHQMLKAAEDEVRQGSKPSG